MLLAQQYAPELRLCRWSSSSPRDGQALVPAQQAKKPRSAQQNQALQLRRCGVKLQIVRTAKAHPLLQLNDLLLTKFPDRHGALPFLSQYTPGRIFYAKGVESTRPVVVYYGKYLENIQYKRGSIYV